MARLKQDWSPRGASIPVCYVTLEYDKLPHDYPAAEDLINVLIHESDPKTLIEEHDMTRVEAVKEGARFGKLVDAYYKNKWYYVRLFAHTLVPTLDPGENFMVRVATPGDIIESNWPPKAIKVAERSELDVLQQILEDKGYACREFNVSRLGSFALQHPKAPKEQIFISPRTPFDKNVGA